MAGQGLLQDKTGILCGPGGQCLEGRALVSTGSGGLQGEPAPVSVSTG